MAFRTKLRSITTLQIQTHHKSRSFSSILNPDSKTPLSSKEKSRAALNLLRSEKNPEKILSICNAAALTPESHLDRIAFSHAFNSLKQSNSFDAIRRFVKESLSNNAITERLVSHFIVLYGQSGLIKDALKLFDEMPDLGVERSVKTLNSLMFSCVLAKEYGELKRVFADFPKKYGLVPDLETYNTVLKGFCESGSASSSHSVMAEMERKGIRANGTTFGVVIAGFYKEEKFEEVGKVMELMKKYGMSPGISIHNERILGLCKLKRASEGKALLDGILSRGMKPNCVTYRHLIYGFCKEGKYDVAKGLFEEMISKKLKPEAECYFTLVYYLSKGKDFKAALGICKECMEKGWIPPFTTMKLLVNGLASIAKVDEAKEIIGVVKEKFPKDADKWTEIEEGLSKE